MKKSRGKFLKATTSWLSDEEISEPVTIESMRKVINDALKLPKQGSAFGVDFYYGSGIFEGMRHTPLFNFYKKPQTKKEKLQAILAQKVLDWIYEHKYTNTLNKIDWIEYDI